MGTLRELADSIVNAFTNVFKFDVDPTLSEREAVEKCVAETGVVAGLIACVQPLPIPLADLVVLTPLYVKMTLQIGKIKGFEVDSERALDIVKEVLGVIGLAGIGQTLIGLLGKVIPVAKIVFTFPLNYAATWAIGNVVDYYFDCLRDGTVPDASVMKELFAEQFRVGKARGQAYDQEEVKEQAQTMLSRADALRAKVASRDPNLKTSTRMEPKVYVAPVVASAGPAPTPAAPGERPKIKITIKPKGDEEPPAPPAEPESEAPVKTIGGEVPGEIEIGFKRAEKTLGDGSEELAAPLPESSPKGESLGDLGDLGGEEQESTAEDAESAEDPDGEEQESATKDAKGADDTAEAEAPGESSDDPANDSSKDPEPSDSGSLIEQLERLGALRERGVLSDEEFTQAKQRLLADR